MEKEDMLAYFSKDRMVRFAKYASVFLIINFLTDYANLYFSGVAEKYIYQGGTGLVRSLNYLLHAIVSATTILIWYIRHKTKVLQNEIQSLREALDASKQLQS